MSDPSKTRKPAPQYKTDWRKPLTNPAVVKYTREAIFSHFHASESPVFPQADGLDLLISSECLAPLLSSIAAFSTPLGSNINSRPPPVKREFKEQVPEWFTEENPLKEEETTKQASPVLQTEEESAKKKEAEKQPVQITLSTVGNIKNLPEEFQGLSIDEEFSKVDEEFEKKQKIVEEDEEIPEWDDPEPEKPYSPEIKTQPITIVCYPLGLVQAQLLEGNPFAAIIYENCTVDEQQRVIPIPNSIAYEKVWYYKDPRQNVQGPFSTIEMFNWSSAGYFDERLMIAHSNPSHFAPLKLYTYVPQGKMREQTQNKQTGKDEEATNSLKSMLGLGQTEKGAWGPKPTNNVAPLTEIQRQQARGKR